MCKSALVLISTDESKNKEMREILKKIPNIKIGYIAPFRIAEELMTLPMLKTDEGDRYFGIEGIKEFTARALSLR